MCLIVIKTMPHCKQKKKFSNKTKNLTFFLSSEFEVKYEADVLLTAVLRLSMCDM